MSDTMAGKHLASSEDELSTPPVEHPQALDATQSMPAVNGAVGAGAQQQVTCPECGNTAQVTLNRRDSHDFCVRCDYPLFWTPTTILHDETLGPDDAALRRLPGTAGRQTVASAPCPSCDEANTLSASTCVRCGTSMHPAPVVPVVMTPAPVLPEPEPAPRMPWWVWALGAATAVLLLAIILFAVRG